MPEFFESNQVDQIFSRLRNVQNTGSRIDQAIALAHASHELRDLTDSMLAPMGAGELAEVIRRLQTSYLLMS